MKIKPLGDRVVLQNIESESTTRAGILLPSASKEKTQMAKVLAVGPGGMVEGKDIVMHVKVGDTVIYSKYAGNEIDVDGQDVLIVHQNDILAVYAD